MVEVNVGKKNMLKVFDPPALAGKSRLQMRQRGCRPGLHQRKPFRSLHYEYGDSRFDIQKAQVEYMDVHGVKV